MTIEVVEAGSLTSVQDPFGRPGWAHVGVPVGGAADPWSARLANRLVGNADATALLEMTFRGPTLRVSATTAIALVGDLDASVDGVPLRPGVARELRAGALLRIGPGRDARGYLAVAGGLVVESLLGSPSTDLRAGFGGIDGRALRTGDRLDVGTPAGSRTAWAGAWPAGPIRVVPGPHADRFAADVLAAAAWRIGVDADRTGARLDGPTVGSAEPEVASMGMPLGAIQVPPDGRPIVMLADRPVTGGYPVPAVIVRADIGRVARLRPGSELRFATVTLDEARRAMQQMEDELTLLDPLGGPDDDVLGWAGAHD